MSVNQPLPTTISTPPDRRTDTIGRGRHTRAVLDQLVVQACRTLEVHQACVFVRDDRDVRSAVPVAGHGAVPAVVGQQFGLDANMAGQVLAWGEPAMLADPPRSRQFRGAQLRLCSGGAAPIRWDGRVRAALSVVRRGSERRFCQRDLDVLCELTDIAAVGLEHAEMRERLEEILEAGVGALATAVDMRDTHTAQHSSHVVDLACQLGELLGLDGGTLVELEFAGRLHDIGKIGVPDAILTKPGPLEPAEWEVMRRHPAWGADVLAHIPGLERVATVVRSHHERWDGGGYPDGLAGDGIPLPSRIIAVCDAYQAMTSDRPYRSAMSNEVALRELSDCAGTQFDPRVVDALVATPTAA